MESKIMQVFYGNDCLPYKDSQRSVHYPIVGNSFLGASSTTQIRFYVRDIGGVHNVSWVAISKLPNGQIGNQVLSNIHYDDDIGEYYVQFDLSAYYTQVKGDLYISLNGYQGGVQVEQDAETDVYTIVGTPVIEATGSIKLSINYAPQLPQGTHFNISDLQQILGALSDKANVLDTFVVVEDIDGEDLSGYDDGQLIYDEKSKAYYEVNSLATSGYIPYEILTLPYVNAESSDKVSDLLTEIKESSNPFFLNVGNTAARYLTYYSYAKTGDSYSYRYLLFIDLYNSKSWLYNILTYGSNELLYNVFFSHTNCTQQSYSKSEIDSLLSSLLSASATTIDNPTLEQLRVLFDGKVRYVVTGINGHVEYWFMRVGYQYGTGPNITLQAISFEGKYVNYTGSSSTTWYTAYENGMFEFYTQGQTDTLLAGKQDTLTFDNTPTEDSDNPVTSDGIYDAIQNAIEIAQGKTKTYVIDDTVTGANVYNTSFNSVNDTISLQTTHTVGVLEMPNYIKDIEDNLIDLGTLKVGDVIYITQTDVPDRWVGSIVGNTITFYKNQVDIDIDATPTENSTNPVSSGGVYTALQDYLPLAGGTMGDTANIQFPNPAGYSTTNTASLSRSNLLFEQRSSGSLGYKVDVAYNGITMYEYNYSSSILTYYKAGKVYLFDESNYQSYNLVFPLKSGTLAITDDLNSYLPLTGGTMTSGVGTKIKIPLNNNNYTELDYSGLNVYKKSLVLANQYDIESAKYLQNKIVYTYDLVFGGSGTANISFPKKSGTIALLDDINETADIDITDTLMLKISGITDELALPSESQVEIKEIVCGAFGGNQLVQNGNFASSSNWSIFNSNLGTLTVSNNKGTINITTSGYNSYEYGLYQTISKDIVIGHKYLTLFTTESSTTNSFTFELAGSNSTMVGVGTNAIITTVNLKYNNNLLIFPNNNYVSGNSYSVSKVINRDLTIRYGSTIADYLAGLSQENAIAWLKANDPNIFEYTDFDSGSIINSNGVLVDTNANLIANESNWLNHYQLSESTGEMSAGAWYQEYNALQDFIKVLPNTTYSFSCVGGTPTRLYFFYYDINKNFISYAYADSTFTITTPNNSNIAYVRLETYGSGNQSALTNTILNVGSTALPYVPHIQQSIQLPSGYGIPQLNANNKLSFFGDTIKGGKLIRKFGTYTFKSDEVWVATSNSWYHTNSTIPNVKQGNDDEITNVICGLYASNSFNYLSNHHLNGICLGDDYKIWIRDDSVADVTELQSKLANKNVAFELAIYTETEYTEPLTIACYQSGYELQETEVPYTLTRNYDVSIKDQVLTNVEVDREQQVQIDEMYEEYKEGLQLVDFNRFGNFGINFANGEIVKGGNEDYKQWCADYDIIVKPNTTYTLSWGNSSYKAQIFYYNGDASTSTYIGRQTTSWSATSPLTFTTPSTCSVIRINFYNSNATTTTTISSINNPMLNKGTQPKPYQDYMGGDVVREGDCGVLLWENGSPDSSFSYQQVSLSRSLSNFKYFIIEFKISASSAQTPEFKKFRVKGNTCYLYIIDTSSGYAYHRSFEIGNLTFSSGYVNGSQDNNACIPIAIYGTNIL